MSLLSNYCSACKQWLSRKPGVCNVVTKKQDNFCDSCGGTNVLIDAWAKFDPETDALELYNTFDNSFCEDCDGECTYERRDIH